MVNLDQAQKNVRNAQDQLDQALKELEKAKKPVEEWEFTDYLSFTGHCKGSQAYTCAHRGPCKVTVRPLGGPEPKVFDVQAYSIRDLETGHPRTGMIYVNNTYKDRSFRITVEEVK